MRLLAKTLSVVPGVVFVLGSMLAGQAPPPQGIAPSASAPASQPAYPLWDGKETVAAYARRAGIKQTERVLDLGRGVALRLTLIPAGKFLMGVPKDEFAMVPAVQKQPGSHNRDSCAEELPQHEVTITKPFYMGIYAVTQTEYQQVTGANPAQFKGPRNPVERVAWDEAMDFCKQASQKAGRTVRLPTEAEWEYACRAGSTTPFNTGATISTDQANYWGSFVWGDGKKGVYRQKTTPVGTFKPNAWGLYDMHGNVEQWCSDWFGKDYYAKSPATDPIGPAAGQRHVSRGGCWGYMPLMCRSASRSYFAPDWHFPNVPATGIRVVTELK